MLNISIDKFFFCQASLRYVQGHLKQTHPMKGPSHQSLLSSQEVSSDSIQQAHRVTVTTSDKHNATPGSAFHRRNLDGFCEPEESQSDSYLSHCRPPKDCFSCRVACIRSYHLSWCMMKHTIRFV